MDDYRAEFRYDHPDAAPGVEEYAVEGLSGSIYYFWSMLPAVLRASRLVAVHNARIAADLSAQHPGVRIETIRMGVPTSQPADGSQERGRTLRRALGIGDSATVFVAFGHVTSEKRIDPILRAVSELAAKAHDIHLLLVGPAEGFPALGGLVERQGLAARVHVTGYVDDRRVADYFAAADACLCLRWPTAGETSSSWIRALAAGRPTVITKLAHLADVPTLDAATSRPSHASLAPVALSVDLLDEDAGLLAAMSKLSTDGQLRADLAGSGHAYWAREHALELMAIDYLRILREAAARETPRVSDLPAHFTDDYSVLVRRIEDEMGVGRRI
jgi:glycosyltransferase involved in cell wall biosynthesis